MQKMMADRTIARICEQLYQTHLSVGWRWVAASPRFVTSSDPRPLYPMGFPTMPNHFRTKPTALPSLSCFQRMAVMACPHLAVHDLFLSEWLRVCGIGGISKRCWFCISSSTVHCCQQSNNVAYHRKLC